MNVLALSGENPNVSTHIHPLVPSCDLGASPSGLLGHIFHSGLSQDASVERDTLEPWDWEITPAASQLKVLRAHILSQRSIGFRSYWWLKPEEKLVPQLTRIEKMLLLDVNLCSIARMFAKKLIPHCHPIGHRDSICLLVDQLLLTWVYKHQGFKTNKNKC